MAEPVEQGTKAARLIEEEERLHARVQARLLTGGDLKRTVNAEHYDDQLILLRDAIAEAKPEDLAPLVEQMTRLAALRARVGGGVSLPVEPASPYFAHMRLCESGRRRDVLIGKRGFVDRNSNIQIVDWRNAPISQIYYRYGEGDDYEEEIGGRPLEGVLELRRNVTITARELRRIGAPQGTFVRDTHGVWHVARQGGLPVLGGGQGTALRAPRPAPHRKGQPRLGIDHEVGRADKHLPEIAALIDRQQFELITQPSSGLVVIQGGAGSGKTTVALHRIAYLHFADRQRFASKRMLIVVPSTALARYVEDVLPSLGVAKVPVVTYRGWARNLRARILVQGPTQYIDESPAAVVRVKKHPRMLTLLEHYVGEQVDAAVCALENTLTGLAGGQLVLDRFHALGRSARERALVPRLRATYRFAKGAPMPSATQQVALALLRQLGLRAKDLLTDWDEALTDRRRLMAGFDGTEIRVDAIEATVRRCARQLLGQISSDAEASPATDGVDGSPVHERGLAGRLDPEDDALILRLAQLKHGGLFDKEGRAIDYSHVAIDEAQDRSAVEIKVLFEATIPDAAGARSVTIAGDTAQRVDFDNGFEDWPSLLRAIGHPGTLTRPLRLSYRSTAEIMTLARDVLGPELAPAEPLVARSGAEVVFDRTGGVGEAVALISDALGSGGLLVREPRASIAILTRFPEQADAYYEGLSKSHIPSLRRIRDQEFPFTPGVDVTDVTQIKGLEFDYVICADVNASSYPATIESRHLLHIAMTRSTHQLWVIATDTPSTLLPAWLLAP